MSSTGGAGSGSGAGGTSTPWWRRPAVLAAASAVAVGVIGGWIQQGGTSLISAMFADDEVNQPIINVTSSDEAFCSTWLLRKGKDSVVQELKTELSGVGMMNQPEAVGKVRKSSGSDLATGNVVTVTVEGKEGRAIILKKLEISIMTKEKLKDDLMGVGSGCGAGIAKRVYEADLDAPIPQFVLSEFDESGAPASNPIGFPYKVYSSEPEVFALRGLSTDVVEWTARLWWVSDGKSGYMDITDNGKPFISFPVNYPKYHFSTDKNDLEEVNR
ncbi:hypothetical protein ACFY7Z_13395 [Streptomyces sp. NPDC012623]|uniref:hypothetical protein n=1 Tax=unclassified Streptomyces TaxID=2593676 RepID=UPI0036CBB4F3